MELATLSLRVQTYMHIAEQRSFLPTWVRHLRVPEQVPSQNFEVQVRFPNLLKIVEIPGAIDEAIFFGGVPTYLYICDGKTQWEYREPNSIPDISAAPSSFEDLRSRHGLPELLHVPHLLSLTTLEALAGAAAANQPEFTMVIADKHYCYTLGAAGTPTSLRISYCSEDEVIPSLTLLFTDWQVNPTITMDAFMAE